MNILAYQASSSRFSSILSAASSRFAAAAVFVAAAFSMGCPNPQSYGTPRTVEPGKIAHTVAVEAWRWQYKTNAGTPQESSVDGTIPVPPTYQARIGVHDQVDLGVRLANLSSLGFDVKYNPVRGSFDLGVVPGLQWFTVKSSATSSSGSSSASLNVFYLHLPLLLGFNVSQAFTVVLAPGVTYAIASGTSSTSDSSGDKSAAATTTGTWARLGLGFNFRVSDGFALHPEVTVMRSFKEQQTMMTFFGLGFNFGRLPSFKDI